MTAQRREKDDVGSSEAIAWAWEKELPPKHKLALLYLANNHRATASIDRPRMAAFIGAASHELDRIIYGLQHRGLCRYRSDDGCVVIQYTKGNR